jgi:hypothetical protein
MYSGRKAAQGLQLKCGPNSGESRSRTKNVSPRCYTLIWSPLSFHRSINEATRQITAKMSTIFITVVDTNQSVRYVSVGISIKTFWPPKKFQSNLNESLGLI